MNFEQSVFVIGMGYVGLPVSIELAKVGYSVVGFDSSSEKIRNLGNGYSHVEGAASADIRQLLASGQLEFSDNPSRVSECSIVIIAVPTPLDRSNIPDLSSVTSACRSISSFLRKGTLIINESTSYPGTLREIIRPILDNGLTDSGVQYACSPERVDPGSKNFGFRNTPRLVAGLTQESVTRAYELYSKFVEEVIQVSSPEVAELAKLLENSFRQVNIALVNQLVPYCKELNIDIREVIDAASSKPYGFMRFLPGAGVGGHCIPIDPLYLSWKAKQAGIHLSLIHAADQVNKEMPTYVAKRLIELADLTYGTKALLLGVTYKPGVSDLRETPAKEIANYLTSEGIEVFWNDPLVNEFESVKKWNPSILVQGAIVVTAQPGLDIHSVVGSGVPVLDCTGTFKGIKGVSQL